MTMRARLLLQPTRPKYDEISFNPVPCFFFLPFSLAGLLLSPPQEPCYYRASHASAAGFALVEGKLNEVDAAAPLVAPLSFAVDALLGSTKELWSGGT
jgi:hypothetical protein